MLISLVLATGKTRVDLAISRADDQRQDYGMFSWKDNEKDSV